MKTMFPRFLALSVFSLGLAAVSTPALARPEIASGDQWLEGVSQAECLSRADAFVNDLDVPIEAGDIDRTGFFEDGVFRILCYAGGESASMLLVFSVHNDSPEIATQFMQLALQEIAQAPTSAR